MPVKIRLMRMGKKKQPTYRVVVVDSRKPRDGAHIEQIGRYDPRQEPSIIEINNDRALKWLQDGAQPTDRARKLLEISGAWVRFRVARGEIHTISKVPEEEPTIASESADAIPDMEPSPAPAVEETAAELTVEAEDEASDEVAQLEEVSDAGADDAPDIESGLEGVTAKEEPV